ncbi:hypothetical protein HanPI659440_Chr12g0475521 [Helianthus annuus]|nr:hypothetical protein HanPI659440_Chr12g0475521 [Helianthus annuus]
MGGAGASPASFLLPRQHQTPPETLDFSGNGARLRLEGVFRHDAKTRADGSLSSLRSGHRHLRPPSPPAAPFCNRCLVVVALGLVADPLVMVVGFCSSLCLVGV